MAEPDLLEGGGEDRARRLPAVPSGVRRAGTAVAVTAVGAALLASYWTSSPASERPSPREADVPRAAASANAAAAALADVQLILSAEAQRDRLIRDVPDSFRDAAGRASAMRHGRTPGNFFLALAYVRTLYGTVVLGEPGEPFVNRGPVLWEPAEFRRYAAPGHGDMSRLLDSFLAVDAKLHEGQPADFSDGAFRAARLLGSSHREATSVARVYEVLDGSGVRQGLPN